MQKRQYRGRLGEFLIEAGHLRARDLERALEIQRVAGGHLGTNLLEMGVVSERVLLNAIGKMHENPTVASHRLESIPKEVSVKVPRDLVRRHNIVPFALHGNTVYIASQRPGDIHIENEVTLATSRLTRTFLGLEVRVQAALHKFHGHSLPVRFSRLLAKLDGTTLSDSREGASADVDSAPRPATLSTFGASTPAKPIDESQWISSHQDQLDPTLSSTVGRKIVWNDFELPAGSEATGAPAQEADPQPSGRAAEAGSLSTAEQVNEKAGSNPSSTARESAVTRKPDPVVGKTITIADRPIRKPKRRSPRPHQPDPSQLESTNVKAKQFASVSSPQRQAPTSLVDAHAALLKASNRDAVGKILMEGLRPFFRRRLLLAKRSDRLLGWRADGPGIRPRNLTTLSFSLASGSPFLAIENGSRFWLSAYHQDAGYQAIASVVGPIQAPDCMILPLRAGRHTIGFLYGDNEEVTVTGQPLHHFLQFSEAAGSSFERIIRRLKEAKITHEPEDPSRDAKSQDPWHPS